MSAETVSANNEYRLTIHVDAEFLADEATVYPIKIDPTIEINKPSDGMQDTTIYDEDNSTTYGTAAELVVGKTQTKGIARSLIRFAGNNFNYIHSSLNVNSATLDITSDGSGSSGNMVVECYMFEGATWSQSTAKWNNVNADNYSSCIASKGFPSSETTKSYNVIYAVKRWVDARCDESDYRTSFDPDLTTGAFNMKKGLLLRAMDSVENGANVNYKSLCSSNNSTDKPSLTVNYSSGILRNNYYTKFDTKRFNDHESGNGGHYFAQDRMNCYAYSLGYFYCTYSSCNSGYFHFSLPGAFSSFANGSDDAEIYADNLLVATKNDAQALGYTITDYTPNSGTIGQYGQTSRLVALVINGKDVTSDFHFYMQHNDGTWSHKNGISPTTNLAHDSYSSSSNSNKILTNENFVTEAVGTGAVRFFKISISANQDINNLLYRSYIVIDDITHYCSLEYTNGCFYYDPGDYLETAKVLNNYNDYTSKIDFNGDTDVYYFGANASRSFQISVSKTDTDDLGTLKCSVYTGSGVFITSGSGTNSATATVNLNAGSQYFIRIEDSSSIKNLNYEYTLSIT